MHASEPASLRSDGNDVLRQLFAVAVNRLHERGVTLEYTPEVIEWLLGQPEWQESLNPLRSLDGCWHQQIASIIENLLLDGQLKEGAKLLVSIAEAPTNPRVQFKIVPPGKTDG